MIAAQKDTLQKQSPMTQIKVIRDATNTPFFLPSKLLLHTPKSGLNPLVDAAGYALSLIGRLNQINDAEKISMVQTELHEELEIFMDRLSSYEYNAEYLAASRYIIAATFDDIVQNKISFEAPAGSMLYLLKQDLNYKNHYMAIVNKALSEPHHAIDLLELIYISLSLGYKGAFRDHTRRKNELIYIRNCVHQTIQSIRGKAPKATLQNLRPVKISQERPQQKKFFLKLTFVTSIAILTLLLSFSYLMDTLTNDADQKITDVAGRLLRESER